MSTTARKTRPKVKVMCRVCSKAGRNPFHLRFTRARQELMVDGKETVHAQVECTNQRCGHKWWSRHPDALAGSHTKDDQADPGT